MKRKTSEYKLLARQTLIGHYKTPIAGFLVMGLISALLTMPFNSLIGTSSTIRSTIISYLSSFIISLITTVLNVGYCHMLLKMSRNKPYSFSDLFYGLRNQPDRYLIVALIMGLISMVLSIPTYFLQQIAIIRQDLSYSTPIIVLSIVTSIVVIIIELSFGQVYFLLLDNEELSPIEGLKQSLRLMSKNKGRLFYMGLSFVGISLLGLLSFGIGLLWIVPYIVTSEVFFYRDLIGDLDFDNE